MSEPTISDKDRRRADKCLNCPACRRARRRQRGLVFRFVKWLGPLCGRCRAYQRVHGRKAHEPIPQA